MKYYILMACVVLCNIAANLTLKSGAGMPPSPYLFYLLSWRAVFGVVLFGCSVFFYLTALRFGTLSASQSITLLQYIGVLLGAKLIFGENFSLTQLLGCFLLCCGVFLIIREA